jgi:hypothetical protein
MRLQRRSVTTMAAFVALAVATLLPAFAHATTVTMGNPNVPASGLSRFGCTPTCNGQTDAQSFSLLTALEFAPAAGVIKSWRVRGVGPIALGDLIGVTFPGPGAGQVGVEELENGERLGWTALPDDGLEHEPSAVERGERFQLNAEVVLTPAISSLSPAAGSAAGGNAVRIGGLYLDSATSVTFGSTPAASFSVDSSNQITAIAPATAVSTVDVRVSGPGGSSEVVSADKYTFTTPASAPPTATTKTTPKTLIQGGPGLGQANPAVTGLSESAARWRRGRSLPRIASAATPVGTKFSFSLNEPATTTFTFTQSVAGRRAHGRCVAPSHANAHKASCKRTVAVGSFSVAGKAGLDKVRFQGRLSSAKTLKPGTYAVSITARNANGLKGVSRSVSFTIVS